MRNVGVKIILTLKPKNSFKSDHYFILVKSTLYNSANWKTSISTKLHHLLCAMILVIYLAIRLLCTSTCWYFGHISFKVSRECSVFQMKHTTAKYCSMASLIVTINAFSLCRFLQLVKKFQVVAVFQDTCTLIWPQFMRYSLVCAFRITCKRCWVQICVILPLRWSWLTDIDMFILN